MAQQAYNALADWFEYLNDDCGYEEWSQYLLSILQKSGCKVGQSGLDIGCGSGYFTRQLYKAGYAVTGVDVSAPMLDKAQALAKREGLSIPCVMQDVSSLTGFKKQDFAVAINDCFNYLPPQKVVAALKKIHAALKKGGILFFDVSSEKKLTTLPPVSIDDREDVTYISFNRYCQDVVTMEVSLFIKQGEGYIRKDETHTQYVYSVPTLMQALVSCGFEVLNVSGHLGQAVETADRIEFLAKRM